MWKINHETWCEEHNRVHVIRERLAVEDINGNVLESDPSDGDTVSAGCAECRAQAEWVE